MTKLYYETDVDSILDECVSYINNIESFTARCPYLDELGKVMNEFTSLVYSGIFHDACGRTIDVFLRNGQLVAEVETEY